MNKAQEIMRQIPMSSSQTDNEKLIDVMLTALKPYPKLKEMLPLSYPQATKFKITVEQLSKNHNEINKIWDHWHFASVLWCSIFGEVSRVRPLAIDILNSLEWFADAMASVDGARGVLKLLTTTGKDLKDASFWEIISIVKLSKLFSDKNIKLLGFERPTGLGNKTADISIAINNTATLVEVEMWHKPALTQCTSSNFQNNIKDRAESKFNKTFPPNKNGVIAIVCMLQTDRLKEAFNSIPKLEPFLIYNNSMAACYFLLTSMTHETNKLYLVDYSTEIELIDT